jgi:hypothetical protein
VLTVASLKQHIEIPIRLLSFPGKSTKNMTIASLTSHVTQGAVSAQNNIAPIHLRDISTIDGYSRT